MLHGDGGAEPVGELPLASAERGRWAEGSVRRTQFHKQSSSARPRSGAGWRRVLTPPPPPPPREDALAARASRAPRRHAASATGVLEPFGRYWRR